ncbi:MAG: preprotein translocase subunit YajC [Pleomorphochaeta sp.]
MNSLFALMGTTATSSSAQAGSMATSMVTFGLIIVIIYFLIIRPQRKRDKEAKDMISSIAKGDKIVTIGGIHGTVVAVREQTVVIKVDDNARIEFSKSAISSVVAKKGASKASAKNKAKSKNAKKAVEEKVVETKDEAKESVETKESTEDKKEN